METPFALVGALAEDQIAADRPSALDSGWSSGPALGKELNRYFAVRQQVVMNNRWLFLPLSFAVLLHFEPFF